ncbi:MAG: outer membrane beta-barrel domain-containing protein [Deltaproteobacteria bacterium]
MTPGLGLSLNDPFIQKLIPELAIGYHISQSLYLGLRGGYAVNTFSGVVSACASTATGTSCGAPSATQLGELPGQISYLGFLEAGWSPIYGKVNLFAEKVVHFDFSALLGVGVLGVGTPASPDGAVPAGSAASPALGPGLGERLFLGEHWALEAELRDYILFAPSLSTQLMFHVGVAFLLGGA